MPLVNSCAKDAPGMGRLSKEITTNHEACYQTVKRSEFQKTEGTEALRAVKRGKTMLLKPLREGHEAFAVPVYLKQLRGEQAVACRGLDEVSIVDGIENDIWDLWRHGGTEARRHGGTEDCAEVETEVGEESMVFSSPFRPGIGKSRKMGRIWAITSTTAEASDVNESEMDVRTQKGPGTMTTASLGRIIGKGNLGAQRQGCNR
jgi:hypothetical protein